ncbi:MAG: hypothetical protein JWQ66_2349 [Mucilaginibacter sp.]|nr:hypothetical protein [Mucilaginibacter sp.]
MHRGNIYIFKGCNLYKSCYKTGYLLFIAFGLRITSNSYIIDFRAVQQYASEACY